MKHFKLFPVLILCTALFILNGCKARHVLIKQTDSTRVIESTKSTQAVSTHKDTGTVETKTITTKTDSGTVETEITPAPGKTITINKDGSFTGEAAKVVIKNKKNKVQKDTTTTTEKKHVADSSSDQSLETKKDSTHVKSKSKDVVSKPSYGWVPYAIGGVLLIILIIWLYLRFKPKI